MVRGTQQHEEPTMANEPSIEERLAALADSDQQQQKELFDDVKSQLAKYEQRDQARNTAQELGISIEQAVAVNAVRSTSPGLSTAEAFAIAQGRYPDDFNVPNPRAYNPGQHGSLRPRGGGAPPQAQPLTIRQRAEQIRAMADPLKRAAAERHLIGSMAAKAAGWQYPEFKG
jgi:hypothetical protein